MAWDPEAWSSRMSHSVYCVQCVLLQVALHHPSLSLCLLGRHKALMAPKSWYNNSHKNKNHMQKSSNLVILTAYFLLEPFVSSFFHLPLSYVNKTELYSLWLVYYVLFVTHIHITGNIQKDTYFMDKGSLKGNSNYTQFWVYALSCECKPHVRCNSNVCVEHNKEKHGVDRYEQVLSFFTIMWDLWIVTENFCSSTAMLHVHVVHEKIMKDKAEFQLDLTEQLPKTVYFARPEQIWWRNYRTSNTMVCTWKEQHPATLCKGCTSYGNRSEITWGCENVWKASMFFWELWKLSHIQNY